jgi:hypothetical protein
MVDGREKDDEGYIIELADLRECGVEDQMDFQ